MKSRIIYSRSVQDDLKEIRRWYSGIRIDLVSAFLKEYRSAIKLILINPLIFEVRYDSKRICFLKTFPFGIHYQYVEQDDLIRVFAIFHTSRDTGLWEKRLFYDDE